MSITETPRSQTHKAHVNPNESSEFLNATVGHRPYGSMYGSMSEASTTAPSLQKRNVVTIPSKIAHWFLTRPREARLFAAALVLMCFVLGPVGHFIASALVLSLAVKVTILAVSAIAGTGLFYASGRQIWNVLSPSPRQKMRIAMEIVQFKKIAETLNVHLYGKQIGCNLKKNESQEAIQDARIDKLRQKIEELSENSDSIPRGTVYQIRKEILEILQSKYYIDNMNNDLADINFIQLLAIKMQCADGLSVLEEHSDFSVGEMTNISQVGDAIKEHLDMASPLFKNNGFFWAIANPRSAADSVLSRIDPLGYSPYENNPAHLGPRFASGPKAMQSIFAPTPTGDDLWEKAVIPGMKKLGIFELYFNYQDASNSAEKKRIEKAASIAQKSGGALKHAVFGFEAKRKRVKDLLKDFVGISEFKKKYIDFFKNNCRGLDGGAGISIPLELLSNEELELVLQSVEKENTNIEGKALSLRDQKEAIIMAIDAMIAARIIQKQMEMVPERSGELDPDFSVPYIRACCKQHVDRGTVQLAAAHLYHGGDTLDTKDFASLATAMLMRAHFVDNRQISRKKLEPMLALMNLPRFSPTLSRSPSPRTRTPISNSPVTISESNASIVS